jgi:hypothetical protein
MIATWRVPLHCPSGCSQRCIRLHVHQQVSAMQSGACKDKQQLTWRSFSMSASSLSFWLLTPAEQYKLRVSVTQHCRQGCAKDISEVNVHSGYGTILLAAHANVLACRGARDTGLQVGTHKTDQQRTRHLEITGCWSIRVLARFQRNHMSCQHSRRLAIAASCMATEVAGTDNTHIPRPLTRSHGQRSRHQSCNVHSSKPTAASNPATRLSERVTGSCLAKHTLQALTTYTFLAHSPAAMDSAPATSPAMPASCIACKLSAPAPTPSISEAVLMRPLAPR